MSKKVIFVCHGNICRSPMAEFIFKKLAADAGRSEEFEVSSAAVSSEEIGNDIYPPAKRTLYAHNIPFGHHAAHKITASEFADADVVVLMDSSNHRRLEWIVGSTANDSKVRDMLPDRQVSDPWYTGDFEQAYSDILEGCTALLEEL